MATKTSRGLRNLNPGNIRLSKVRYKGERQHSTDPAFKQFESIEAGYRAIFVLLHTYRVRGYADSIATIISRYAPPSENNTQAYIRQVCKATGIDSNKTLDTKSKEEMVPIVCAISQVENGIAADKKAVERGWEMFMADF